MSEDDAYLKTVDRLEPDIAFMDATACLPSIAISLRRIADIITKQEADRFLAMSEWKLQQEKINYQKLMFKSKPWWWRQFHFYWDIPL